jgi:tRNA(Arg) A34 adenosine deaminase TadA
MRSPETPFEPATAPEDVALRCLALGWRSLCHRTLPIGAVLTDPDGTVVAEGRGRMLEPPDGGGAPAGGGPLAGTPIAHAEMNVLAQLDADRRYPDHTLDTSLEPCLMCAGAAGMAGVGRVVYLGADPYAGAAGSYRLTPYLEEEPMRLEGPAPGRLGRLAMALHVAFYLRHDPRAGAVAVHRRHAPRVMSLAHRVAALPDDADLADLLAAGNRDPAARPSRKMWAPSDIR